MIEAVSIADAEGPEAIRFMVEIAYRKGVKTGIWLADAAAGLGRTANVEMAQSFQIEAVEGEQGMEFRMTIDDESTILFIVTKPYPWAEGE